MDHVRAIISWLRRYHFWLLNLVILGVALGLWFTQTGALEAEARTRQSTLDSKFTGLDSIKRNAHHPNETFVTAISEQTEKLKTLTNEAHAELYRRQARVLDAPEFLPDEVRQPLARALTDDRSIPETLRRQYMNFSVAAFRELFKTLQLRQPEDDGKFRGLIVWPEEARETLAAAYHWEGTPSDLQTRLSVEDYQCYRVLIDVLNAMNEGSSDHLAAVVKQIGRLAIGQGATTSEGGMAAFMAPAAPLTDGRVQAGRVGRPVQRDPKYRPDGPELLANRYLDDTGQPIASGEPKHPFPQYRLVPVRMQLLVDQRRLPRVLAKLSSAAVPIEILQVQFNPSGRFNPYEQRATGGAAGQAGGTGASGTKAGTGRDPAEGLETTPHDVSIEILAQMYLFNPPQEMPAAEGEPGVGEPTAGEEETGGATLGDPATPAPPEEEPPAETPSEPSPPDPAAEGTEPAEPPSEDTPAPADSAPPASRPAERPPAPADAPPQDDSEQGA